MNKTIVITGGVVIVLLAIVGGFAYVGKNVAGQANPDLPAPSDVANTNQPAPTPVRTQKPGAPFVTTSANVIPSDTSAVVMGTVIPNGAFTIYRYEYSVFPDLRNNAQNPSQTIGSGFGPIPAPSYLTSLMGDTTYYFRLVAENQYGKVAGAQYSFHTTKGSPPPMGSIPTTRTMIANGITRTTANVNGEVTPNQASTSFWFEYGQSQNLGDATAFESVGGGTAKSPVSMSLSNLNPATIYYFRINAQNQFGTVNGTILSFKTLGPSGATAPAVTTRSATNVSTSTVTFRGTVNPNGAETVYWFEYSTDSLLGSVLLHATEQRTASTVQGTVSVETALSGLSSKTNYYFRLVAQNSMGTVRGERATFRTR